MQAVFANAEVMPFCEGPARDGNVAFGGSAQSPKSLKVCFGLWVTVVGLAGSGGGERRELAIWL